MRILSLCAAALLFSAVGFPETASAKPQCYVGLHAGYGQAKADPETPGTPTIKADGALGGIHAGCNHWSRGWYIGYEAGASYANISGSVKDGNFLTYSGETDWMLSLVGRVGVLLPNYQTSLYLLGGGAALHNTATMSCPAGAGFGFCSFAGQFTARDSMWTPAAVVGFGIEHFVPDWNLRFGLEYRHFFPKETTAEFQTPLGLARGESQQKDFGTAMLRVTRPF